MRLIIKKRRRREGKGDWSQGGLAGRNWNYGPIMPENSPCLKKKEYSASDNKKGIRRKKSGYNGPAKKLDHKAFRPRVGPEKLNGFGLHIRRKGGQRDII